MKFLDLFATVPLHVKQQPEPFTLSIPEAKLHNFQTLLSASPLAKETYENLQSDGRFGVTHKWMADTKEYWNNTYDWRTQEAYINSHPQFKSNLTDDDGDIISIHFTALFSANTSAVPVVFFHGWPGSFLEFLPLLDLLSDNYTPETLPYHIVVPSLPGFTLSSGPPLTKDWSIADTARIMHKLMVSLGFDQTGYIVQGGDIGSIVARIIAATYPECKGAHVNYLWPLANGELFGPQGNLSTAEQGGVDALNDFINNGDAYFEEHRTRPSTIGFVLASSPIAHLAWIGEKFLQWSDPASTPSLDGILNQISLYWLTDGYPSSIYAYRDSQTFPFVNAPTGYSWFPREVGPVPRSWAEESVNLVYFKAHEIGGHFAAWEVPESLWKAVEEFIEIAWK